MRALFYCHRRELPFALLAALYFMIFSPLSILVLGAPIYSPMSFCGAGVIGLAFYSGIEKVKFTQYCSYLPIKRSRYIDLFFYIGIISIATEVLLLVVIGSLFSTYYPNMEITPKSVFYMLCSMSVACASYGIATLLYAKYSYKLSSWYVWGVYFFSMFLSGFFDGAELTDVIYRVYTPFLRAIIGVTTAAITIMLWRLAVKVYNRKDIK